MSKETAELRAHIDATIDGNSGKVWKLAEEEWQRITAEALPKGMEIHCIQIPFLTIDGAIEGASCSSPLGLSKHGILQVLTAVIAQLSSYRVANVEDGKPPCVS